MLPAKSDALYIAFKAWGLAIIPLSACAMTLSLISKDIDFLYKIHVLFVAILSVCIVDFYLVPGGHWISLQISIPVVLVSCVYAVYAFRQLIDELAE